MTFAEMHERIDVLLDKANLPWFNPNQKDIFLQFSTNEFVKNRYDEFEVNEKRREDIRPLVTVLPGTGTTVALPSDFMFALSLKGTFNIDECGTIVQKERSIRPFQHDDLNKVVDDPFNKADDEYPFYTSNSAGYVISSTNAPVDWTLVYIKRPVVVDGTNTPNGTLTLPEYTHEEIINLAVRKMKATIEDPTYNLQVNEIQNQE
jgi:hypothetical protein